MPCLSCAYEPAMAPTLFFDGHLRIDTMEIEQIDDVGAEADEGCRRSSP
jgi:hypothetical protein